MVHSSAEYYADALFDLGPSDTIITISYRHQPQIRCNKYVLCTVYCT